MKPDLQLIRGGVVPLKSGQYFVCRAAGINLPRNILQPFLIAAQIGIANFKQAIKRNIDHLFVQQLLTEILDTDAKVAFRGRQ